MKSNILEIEPIRFSEIEKDWNQLYHSQDMFTFYQSYDYLKKTGKGFLPRKPLKAVLSSECTYMVKDQNGILAIFSGLKSRGEISFRGMFTGAGNLDFVYRSDMTQNQFDKIFTYIKEKNCGCKIILDRVSEQSLTRQFCENSQLFQQEEEQICVAIQLMDNYNAWYNGLSKSVRQNIRTSYNRMNTDKQSYEFQFNLQQGIEQQNVEDMIKLFSNRAADYKHLNKRLSWIMRIVKESDPVVRYLMKGNHTVYSFVKINGKLAAAMCGFLNQDGSWVIPKLAIDMEFSRYSPGGILLNESIKYICENKIGITGIDLSRGEEQYKYRYGGKEHLNYKFIG